MNNDNKILEITKDVKWIGVLDPDIVTFDVVMETKYGTTYNSYFVNDQKKAIIETTKEKFWNIYFEKIKNIIKPEKIDYIILNHTEPDHSGNLNNLLNVAVNATVVGSRLAISYLEDQIGKKFKNLIVKDGDTLDLGNKTLQFIGAPNLHWPDSIYSYLVEDKVLFTCDSFGAHFCNENMFEDKVGNYDDSFKYYFDVILKPYSKFMLKAIEKIKPLEISAICTGHGPILTKNYKKYIELSEKYSKQALAEPQKNKIFIPYVSAYHNTEEIAKKIAEGILAAGNFSVDVCDIENLDLGNLDEKIASCTGIIIGSPTINQNTLLQIYKMFALINPLRDKGKIAGSFGSYGWSGEATKIINSVLKNLKLNVIEEPLTFKFSIHEKDYDKCIEYGKLFAAKLLECKTEE